MRFNYLVIPLLVAVAAAQLGAGCSRDATPLSADAARNAVFASKAAPAVDAPADLVAVTYGGKTLELWPYLTPDGSTAEDPVNLLFVGAGASALQIRAALLALDGDRTAYGFPSSYPFNATWSDAMGGVQAGYAEGAEWVGGVIQLQLGDYAPVRFHLRLYDTGLPFGSEGEWVIGGAHFEISIPGTPEHQVVSWERAEEMVALDLMRAGLLLADPSPTGVINDTPDFRTIPPAIYNGIPDAIKQYCELPLGASAVPVPIKTNGHATILRLATGSFASGNGGTESLEIQFQQVIPKPFCASGPADYYLVEGPVNLIKHVKIDDEGRFSYQYQLGGQLTATPYGGGEPFDVRIHDIQTGFVDESRASVNASIQRVAPQDGGSELLRQWLNVGSQGRTQFRTLEHCLTP